MVSLTLRLIGARISCFRRFRQPLIHIEAQGPQIARESLQKLGSSRARRHAPKLAKAAGQIAPRSRQALLKCNREGFSDVAPMKADLLPQKVASSCFCPD